VATVRQYGEVHLRDVALAYSVFRRPFFVNGGDPKSYRLKGIPIWECPMCHRRWHWPRQPGQCGFCD
jgi:hypothetical protein